jgi:polyisoprenoid-binding protein YceI
MPASLTRRSLLRGGLAGLVVALASRAGAQARDYDLVAERSRVSFVFYTGGAAQTGILPVATARIIVNPGNLTRSSADVTADVRQISTGLVFFTQAIKSPDLLDAEAHPTVRFRSRAIRLGARGRISEGAEIDGDLTLRGITRPITLAATLSRPAGSAPDDLTVLYIRLNGTLDRNDFGATGYAGLAENRVDLDISAEIRART